MLNLYILLAILLSIGTSLIAISLDIRVVYEKVKGSVEKERETIIRTLGNMQIGKIASFIDSTEKRIQMSNVRLYLPRYNILLHYIVCILTGLLAFSWIKQYMNFIVSFIFSFIGLSLPYLILQLLKDVMNDRIKKSIVDFLIILKNYLVATGDVFTAFEQAKDFFIEPLKSYVGIMVYEYKHKVNPVKCINNFIDKIQHKELQLFLENLKICYIHGGDIVSLLDEYIMEISMMNDDSDKEDVEDQMLKMGLYLMLMMNFGIVFGLLNSEYALEITGTFYGNVVFILDIIISLYIGYSALDKIN